MAKPDIRQLIARADELADKFEGYEPQPGDDTRPLPPLIALQLAAWRRAEAERDLADAVAAARAADMSWRAVGAAIGTSGEAARQRYANHAA